MSAWQTQRLPNRRRRNGCGPVMIIALLSLVIVAIVAAVIFIALLPQIGARIVGLQPAGQTERLFIETRAPAVPDIANVLPQARTVANQVQVNAGASSFALDTSAVPVQTGLSASGVESAVVSLTEAEVNTLCRQRTTLCTTGDGQIRNATIDLRAGGAVVYAEFRIPETGLWQRVGVVVKINEQRNGLTVAGVDIDGTLYAIPNDGIATALYTVSAEANRLIQESVVAIGGQNYRIRELFADTSRLTVILR